MPRLRTIDVYPADHRPLAHPFSRVARVPALRLDTWLSAHKIQAPFSSYRLLLDQSRDVRDFKVWNDYSARMGWLYEVDVPPSFGDFLINRQRDVVVSTFMRVLHENAELHEEELTDITRTLSAMPWEAQWTSSRFRLSNGKMTTATFSVNPEGELSGTLSVDGEERPRTLTHLAPDVAANLSFFKAVTGGSPLAALAGL